MSCVLREHFNPNHCKRWPATMEHLGVPERSAGRPVRHVGFPVCTTKRSGNRQRSHFLVPFPSPACLIWYRLPCFRVHNSEM